jgi:hypothetical protein
MSFSDFVQKQAMPLAELPLVHTTEYAHQKNLRWPIPELLNSRHFL